MCSFSLEKCCKNKNFNDTKTTKMKKYFVLGKLFFHIFAASSTTLVYHENRSQSHRAFYG